MGSAVVVMVVLLLLLLKTERKENARKCQMQTNDSHPTKMCFFFNGARKHLPSYAKERFIKVLGMQSPCFCLRLCVHGAEGHGCWWS